MNSEEFSDHMWKLNNYGITLTAVCLGNELGLLDLLMENDTPMTSIELADKADMKERYIREWLGCMVAAQIVKLETVEEKDKYFIPSERHATIKGATAWGYAAVSWVKRFQQTKACFRNGGPWGNDYDSEDSFWSFFGGFRERTGDNFLETAIMPCLDSDFREKLDSGIQILDLGCGTGTFSLSLAQRYPQSTITGLDACDKPLKIANEALQKTSLRNVAFGKGDALKLDENLYNKFGLVFLCDCLHDLPDPKTALNEVTKVLTDDGKLVIIEVRPHSNQAENAGDMLAAMFYSCSIFSCLQSSMMAAPRVGYGACWGKEEMTKTIKEVLNIDKNVELPMLHAVYVCSKKKR